LNGFVSIHCASGDNRLVVHARKRGHEMIFDLPTDERKPLFGAAGAKLGLCQSGLEADDAILTFRPRAAKALLDFDLNARNTVKGNLGISLRLLGELLRLRELAIQVAHAILHFALYPSDARVSLLLRPLDLGIGVGLQFAEGGFGFRP
jgi:hypothetical protein